MRPLLPILLLAIASLTPVAAQTEQRCFPETGRCISGRLREYWEQNGGLPVFGLPITPAQDERNRDTGQTYVTQWFERARLELHPENAVPYDVLLGRLGDDILLRQRRDWKAERDAAYASAPPAIDRSDPSYFPETDIAIAPQFVAYWRTHGLELGDGGISRRESLALFGAPLTLPVLDANPDGDDVFMQWFERARFEVHGSYIPDPDGTYDVTVLLGRLGAELAVYDVPSTSGRIMLTGFGTPPTGGALLIDGDTGARVVVPGSGEAAWSPDGSRFVLGFTIYAADGTRERELDVIGNAPVWSPDGRQIAYSAASYPSGGDIFGVDVASGQITQLTNAPDDDLAPDWSARGQIAYMSYPGGRSATGTYDGYEVWVMDAQGGERTRLTTCGGTFPRWSPDGARIAFSCDDEVYLVNADGSGQTRLTDVGKQGVYGIDWSRDGRRLLFFAEEGPYNGTLYIINADGSGLSRVGYGVDAAWSPDGTRIVTVEDQRVGNFTYVQHVDRTNRRLLVRGGSDVVWSPR